MNGQGNRAQAGAVSLRGARTSGRCPMCARLLRSLTLNQATVKAFLKIPPTQRNPGRRCVVRAVGFRLRGNDDSTSLMRGAMRLQFHPGRVGYPGRCELAMTGNRKCRKILSHAFALIALGEWVGPGCVQARTTAGTINKP
jgi:hypothetical protein